MKLLNILRRSVRAKITALVVATTLVALTLTALALIAYTLRDYRQAHLADATTQADVLARASAAALAFKDQKEASKNLSLLKARTDVVQAAIYDDGGELFAAYSRDGIPNVPQTAAVPQHRFLSDKLELFQRVQEGEQLLGTVYLQSEHRLRERLVVYIVILCVVMAVAMASALALSAWLQGAVTAPISSISNVANAVVERRDFSMRAVKTSEDEFGALTDAFNRMLEEIDRQTKALVESEQRFRSIADSAPVLMWLNDESGALFVNRAYLEFVGVDAQDAVSGYDWAQFIHPHDRESYVNAWLTAAKQGSVFDQEFRFLRHDGAYRWMRSIAIPRSTAEGQRLGHTGCTFDVHDARESADLLRTADRRKDEFLATLAHELRNPLAPIRNAVHLIALDDNGRCSPALRQMLERQVSQMVRLVDDLMDVSRVSRGTIELRRERLDLLPLIKMATETSKPLIDQARHRLEMSLPVGPLMVDGDGTRLAQIVANLLNNAAKYTNDGGRIHLGAWRDGNEAFIAVRDNGMGLTPDQLPRLFEMFSQFGGTKDRVQSGLGIGLSLVKRLVEMHGGNVNAESAGLGCGSTFTVRLPLAEVSDLQSQLEDSNRDAKGGLHEQRVLVVDDNRDAADSLALLLEVLGAHVQVAHNGAAALDACERFVPHVVLLDLGMPGMSGFEVAQLLRARVGAAVRIVALTGWGQAKDRERTRAAGFDHHLVKPADINALQALLGEPEAKMA